MVFTNIQPIIALFQLMKFLKNNDIKGEGNANVIHYEVGREVRDSIKRLGGTMPEDLPTPEKSLKELEKDNNKLKE